MNHHVLVFDRIIVNNASKMHPANL